MALLRLTIAGLLLSAGGALAQGGACQLVDSASGPPRKILRCPQGLRIEAEAGADVRQVAPPGTERPSAVRVESGAALADVPPGYSGGFQIVTPRAVASVRGTQWIVDVQPADTAVYVLRGEVEVRRVDDSRRVALRKNDGVDVRDDGEPLVVRQWAPARAAALRARFGR